MEWNLDENATEFFLDSYLRASGDNARHRIAAFVLAYLTFRMAYCGMALTTVIGTPEESRLQAAYHTYQQRLAERMVTKLGIIPPERLAGPTPALLSLPMGMSETQITKACDTRQEGTTYCSGMVDSSLWARSTRSTE